MFRIHPAAADVLGGGHDRRVAGVEVHLERIRDVARHDRALEEMDVLQRVDDAADVVEVGDQRFAIPAVRVDHAHGGAGRAEIDLLAPGLHVMARILSMQHEVPRRLPERVLDERAREQQPAVFADRAAGARENFDAGRRCVRDADLGEEPQRGVMHLLHGAVAQGAVIAAGKARLYGAQIVRQWRRALRASNVAAAAARRGICICHVPTCQM